MAITFPTVFQSAISTDPAATAAGYLTPTRYNTGCSPAGLGTNQVLFSTGATTLVQSANLTYSDTGSMSGGPLLKVGSGATTTAGFSIGTQSSGEISLWHTGVTASGANCILDCTTTQAFLNATNNCGLAISGGSILTATSTGVSVASGKNYGIAAALMINTAPTISSGFGTGAAIASSNGSATFRIGVGTTSASSGVIGLPTATNGWNAIVRVFTPSSTSLLQETDMTASGTTSITLTNYTVATGVATAWPDNTILIVQATAY